MTVSKYQVSSKLPDGRIFVIGGDNYAEFKANLDSALGSVDAEGLLTTMATSLVGAPTSIAQAVANLAPLGVTPAPTQTFTPSTAPVGRTCKHGPMQTRTGTGAKGPWKAYMCPSPKGTPDQCDPQWIRRNDPEWSSF
jgi:hypothetical protein